MERIVRPFRGIRYQTPEYRDLSAVTAPPYDVVSEAMRAELLGRHEHNFIRLELPQDRADQEGSRYLQAAATLRQWLDEGVLVQDERAALYVLEQEFASGGRGWRRRTVFALARLPEKDERHVLAHEGTLSAPKRDRLELVRACRAMMSPVMVMIEDPESRLLALLHQVAAEPDAQAEDCSGVRHRMWVIQDESAVGAICSAVGSGPLFIADGHHRFETAVAYREEMRSAHPKAPADASFNYALVCVASAADEGLKILPTHRLIAHQDGGCLDRFKQRMADQFAVEKLPAPQGGEILSRVEEAKPGLHVFAAYCGDGHYYLLTARQEAPEPRQSAVDSLDVSVLHSRLIDPVLASARVPTGEDGRVSHDSKADRIPCRGAHIAYITEEAQARAAVDGGDFEIAFFLRPTRVSEVMAVAAAGQRMPGKSTYFYPKLPSGFVLSQASEVPI